jgi:hypothetical protein
MTTTSIATINPDLLTGISNNFTYPLLELDPRNVGNLSGKQTFYGSVGSNDTSDIYGFRVDVVGHYNADRGTQLQLSLYGLSADADLRLIKDSNSNSVFDSTDEIIRSSTNSGASSEYIDITGLKTGDYFVEVSRYSGETSYTLEMNTPSVYYEFTYNYGDGEYYKGYGYTKAGENFHKGQVIYQPSANETGNIGYYVIDSANPTSLTGYGGQVVVNEYYDRDSYRIADTNPSGGTSGHLHDKSLTWNWGTGDNGLGSESGLAHIDGHAYGFDTTTFAVFNNYSEADLIIG